MTLDKEYYKRVSLHNLRISKAYENGAIELISSDLPPICKENWENVTEESRTILYKHPKARSLNLDYLISLNKQSIINLIEGNHFKGLDLVHEVAQFKTPFHTLKDCKGFVNKLISIVLCNFVLENKIIRTYELYNVEATLFNVSHKKLSIENFIKTFLKSSLICLEMHLNRKTGLKKLLHGLSMK